MKRNRFFLFSLAFLLVLPVLQSQTQSELEYLDQYYQKALKSWNVPGMAIAIVNNDKIIFEKGYGFASLESKTSVDEHTLFALASNTKSFTATALAILVDQEKLSWDDKVRTYLPWFDMYDDYVGREMTIEDLLSHRSGLKTFSGDLLWFGTDKSTEEVVRNTKYLEPKYGFRTHFGYSNIMYMAAGLIIENITGESYIDFIRSNFIEPLGMNHSVLSVNKLADLDNVATPYYIENDQNVLLEWMNWDNIAPAGGLISSAHDIAKWLMFNVNRGNYLDKKYLRDNTFEELTTPRINFKINSFTRKNQPSKHFRSYGMGWSLNDYYGKKVLSHGGGYDGMISKTCVVPEAEFGMVVLTNSLNYLPSALIEKTLDVILGKEKENLDYASLYHQSFLYNQKEKENISNQFDETRGTIIPRHLPLENYTGLYRDKMYGDVKVWIDEDQLHFDMIPTPIFKAKLRHWNDHIFTFRFDKHLSSLPGGKLWFQLDQDGNPHTLLIDVKNPDFDFREFEFVRVKE